MHFERRHGSQKQAIQYCKKDNYEDFGERRIQGERTDLAALRKKIADGARRRDILEDLVNGTQLRILDAYYTYLYPEKRVKPNVYWYYGPTSSGKTMKAKTFNDIFWKKQI